MFQDQPTFSRRQTRQVAQNTVSKFVPQKSPIVPFETKDRKRWNHKHKITFCSTLSVFDSVIFVLSGNVFVFIRFRIWFQFGHECDSNILGAENFHEVKWSLTHLTKRSALSCCRSAVSIVAQARSALLASYSMCLVQRFRATIPFVKPLDHFICPHPSPFIFSTDKSVWQVPGSIGVGAHGWKARVYQP